MMDSFIPTNTLASANFDILKIDGVEDPLININKLATMDFEESCFSTVVKFINETNDEITDHKMTFYANLREAGTEMAVLESFSDYFVKVKEVIAKFIQFLRNLVDRFIASINKFFSSDKYIIKHEKDIDKFKAEDEFWFDGYNFTFSPSVPSSSAGLAFDADLFSDLVPTVSNGEKFLNPEAIKNSVAAIDLDSRYDEFRSAVIGKPEGRIYTTEFNDELFMVYRDGASSPVKVTADQSYIRTTLKRYKNYKEMVKQVTHQQTEIEKTYTNIQKQVQNVVKSNGNMNTTAFLNNLPSGLSDIKVDHKFSNNNGATMSAELLSQVDIYTSLKVNQIQEYSNIHLLAFGAKLDAMKDCFVQDRNVLYNALSKVAKHDALSGKR